MAGPLVEVLNAIAAFILELVTHLVASVLSASFIIYRRRGLQRICAIGGLFFSAYLLIALLRGFIPAINQPLPGWPFSWPLVTLAIIGLFIAGTAPFALSGIANRAQDPDNAAETRRGELPILLIYALSIAMVLGTLALYSSAYRAPLLTERLCQEAWDLTSPKLRDSLRLGLDLAQDIAGRDLAGLSSCGPGDD